PEPEAAPLIGSAGGTVDADDTEVTVDRMTEEELLKGLEGLTPPEEQPEEDEKRPAWAPITAVTARLSPGRHVLEKVVVWSRSSFRDCRCFENNGVALRILSFRQR
ncbi:MAG: DNA-directed polymerase subunit omega, partial [Alphaproteobacteria bacterium]|nr:DNA-directed polymerase subunit omega [Alphaproteobacteria bacterium]